MASALQAKPRKKRTASRTPPSQFLITRATPRSATLGQWRDRTAARGSLRFPYMALRVEWAEWAIPRPGFDDVRPLEAATVLGDPLSRTIADPAAPAFDQSSFVTMGLSSRARMLVVHHVDHGQIVRIISARRALQRTDARHKTLLEYDFRTGLRGKYASRYWDPATTCTCVRPTRRLVRSQNRF